MKEVSETSSDRSISLRKSIGGVKKADPSSYDKDMEKSFEKDLYIKTPV